MNEDERDTKTKTKSMYTVYYMIMMVISSPYFINYNYNYHKLITLHTRTQKPYRCVPWLFASLSTSSPNRTLEE